MNYILTVFSRPLSWLEIVVSFWESFACAWFWINSYDFGLFDCRRRPECSDCLDMKWMKVFMNNLLWRCFNILMNVFKVEQRHTIIHVWHKEFFLFILDDFSSFATLSSCHTAKHITARYLQRQTKEKSSTVLKYFMRVCLKFHRRVDD